MRQYEPIWNALKSGRICAITANPALHPRIVKAVVKEKYQDVGWKMQMADDYCKSKIWYQIKGTVITFRLLKGIGFSDLGGTAEDVAKVEAMMMQAAEFTITDTGVTSK